MIEFCTQEKVSMRKSASRRGCAFLCVVLVGTAGCIGGVYSRETPYPGSAKRVIISGNAAGGGFVSPEGPNRPPNPQGAYHMRRYIFEVKASDGTTHIVGTQTAFSVGDCISFEGYADGPSRTHWSTGRVTVERIPCDSL